MRRLVIVGAGISGLAAAWAAARTARQQGLELEILLLEKSGEAGGKAKSVHSDGYLVEIGPTAFMGGEPALEELVDLAGLRDQCTPAQAAAAHRFIVRGGKLREVPTHPLKFATAGILGPGGLLRIALEPFIRKRTSGEDESVHDFARRRIGAQSADRLVSPMVLGVFAGDAKRLSLPAAFPRLAALEREHGSLIRGLIAKRKDRTAGGPGGPAGGLFSFRDGLQSLPVALAEHGPFEVRLNTGVREIVPSPESEAGWRVLLEGQPAPLSADAVILSGEPWAMAPVVRGASAALADLLDGISCPPVAVVALAFEAETATGVPRGFGVLIPRSEGYRILGCLWDSYLFEGRSPAGTVLVHAMLGGAVDPDVGSLSEEELIWIVRADLARLLQLTAEPVFQHLKLWPRAIPQYELGHLERVRRIEWELDRLPGLWIAGNALKGIAFGKAAAAGKASGEAAVSHLAARRRSP